MKQPSDKRVTLQDIAKSANNNASLQKMMAVMSFEALLKNAGDAVPQELIRNINEQLQKIRKS